MNRNGIIQAICEFSPVLAFFIAGQIIPFIPAVTVLLSTTIICFFVSLVVIRQIPLLPLLSTAITVIAAVLTIFFAKEQAIILADTVYFFGLAFLITIGFTQQKHFLERVFGITFAITKRGWGLLSWRWLILLLTAGAGNELVRFFATPEFWIDYRSTKIVLITLFAFYQFRLAQKHRIPNESNRWGLRINTSETA